MDLKNAYVEENGKGVVIMMLNEKINLCKNAQEFLFYSYFKKSWEELKSDQVDALYSCFRSAYGDFKRTMSFIENVNDFPKEVFFEGHDKKYYEDHKGYIWLGSMLSDILKNGNDEKTFTKKHFEICKKIVDNASAKSVFSYGQAQKWLNMTLKYMFMMNLNDDDNASVKEVLHVPLDRYILIAVLNKNKREKIFTGSRRDLINPAADDFNFANSEGALHFTTDKDGKITKNSELCELGPGEATYVSWSNLKYYENYEKIQDKIKKCIPEGLSPLEWENKVWLIASGEIK